MKKLKPLTELKRRPKTLVELFKTPGRWIKHALHSEDHTGCCIVGGANFIRHGVFSWWDTGNTGGINPVDFEALQAKIAKAAGIRGLNLVIWNNDPNLTHSKFLRVLKKAKV